MREHAEFRRMVKRVQSECRREKLDLSPSAVEELVADLVSGLVGSLGVREDAILRSHLAAVDVSALVRAIEYAGELQKPEARAALPVVFALEDIGRLVASLAQAIRCVTIRCVSLESKVLPGDDGEKWEAIDVLAAASDGLIRIGEALEKTQLPSQLDAVALNVESLMFAKQALARSADKLHSNTWTYGRGQRFDNDLVSRMLEDLEKLAEQERDVLSREINRDCPTTRSDVIGR
ncbi:hypothetical protein [Micromonospora sp. WMMA1976]|uniref:hypothetical protein n=1 Tax=Micromonospora sp. WMMA1976 TaxID=3014995 RepID=UPI00248CFF57|nr:hypothetical protein [Micromonospora sp. WMMA1976]WBC01096.1 hypothetical protein O7546_18185 [Micromonospora sp. WMMA1976]